MKSPTLRQYDGDAPDFSIEITDAEIDANVPLNFDSAYSYAESRIKEMLKGDVKSGAVTITSCEDQPKHILDVFVEYKG